MSENRTSSARIFGSAGPRRRRWVIGAVGALGASGLLLGGVAVPVSADDLHLESTPHASAGVQDGCATAAASTGQADGSVSPHDAAGLQADGDGTASVSVCGDDLGGSIPEDPGGSGPGDLEDALPEDLGALAAEVVGSVTGELEGGLPGDGGNPLPGDPDGLPGELDDSVPGDPGDIVPGGVPGGGGPGGPGGDLPDGVDEVVPEDAGGLVPGGLGIDASDILDRLSDVIPGSTDDGEAPGGPGGPGGNGPAVNTPATGSVSGSVVVGGEDLERDAPTDMVLGAELERGTSTEIGAAVAPSGNLPRTGGGLGSGALRLIAVLGLARAAISVVNRRRPSAWLVR